MNMMHRSKVIEIGNSRGIRNPQALLDQAGLTGEVEMAVKGNKLIISPLRYSRQDWGAQFADMADFGDDRLLDQTPATQWAEDGWIW
jgi:antitoxin MazE